MNPNLKKLFASEEFKWINIFLRWFLISFLLMYVNYKTNFNSWWVGLITGMLIVYVTWQFTDFLNSRRRLE